MLGRHLGQVYQRESKKNIIITLVYHKNLLINTIFLCVCVRVCVCLFLTLTPPPMDSEKLDWRLLVKLCITNIAKLGIYIICYQGKQPLQQQKIRPKQICWRNFFSFSPFKNLQKSCNLSEQKKNLRKKFILEYKFKKIPSKMCKSHATCPGQKFFWQK